MTKTNRIRLVCYTIFLLLIIPAFVLALGQGDWRPRLSRSSSLKSHG